MSIADLIRVALKSMTRNKMRTALTMLGIIIGVASVISMLAIGQGSKDSIQEQISNMGTNMIIIRSGNDIRGGIRLDNNNNTLINENLIALRNKADLLSDVSPSVNGRGQAIHGALNWPTSMQGVDAHFFTIRSWPIEQGRNFNTQDILKAAKVCLIGKTVLQNLFPGEENPIGEVIRFKNIPFKIIGVLSTKGENTFGQDQDDVVMVPFTTMQKRVLGITYLQSIFASAINQESSEEAVEQIRQILRSEHHLKDNEDDFSVRTQAELLKAFGSTSELLSILLGAISGISLLVGGIGIMNIMYVSVTERTKEIGLRMAVGAKRSDILKQFLAESVIVSLSGGFLGILLGFSLTWILNSTLNWPVHITTFSVVLSFIVCFITGVFFGYTPARKASSLDPIEALRYE